MDQETTSVERKVAAKVQVSRLLLAGAVLLTLGGLFFPYNEDVLIPMVLSTGHAFVFLLLVKQEYRPAQYIAIGSGITAGTIQLFLSAHVVSTEFGLCDGNPFFIVVWHVVAAVGMIISIAALVVLVLWETTVQCGALDPSKTRAPPRNGITGGIEKRTEMKARGQQDIFATPLYHKVPQPIMPPSRVGLLSQNGGAPVGARGPLLWPEVPLRPLLGTAPRQLVVSHF